MIRKIAYFIFFLAAICNSRSAFAQTEDKGTGLAFLPEEEYKKIPLASTAMMGNLPSSKDLSAWFPTPGSQGMQGSCVAWAVAYGLKTYQEAVEKRQQPSMGNATLFSPAYIYNQVKINGCDNGAYIPKALDLLKTQGVASLSQFPYDPTNCDRQPSANIKTAAKSYAIADWRTVPTSNEAEVKSHIASGFPVVIGMLVDEGFQRLQGDAIYQGPTGNEKGGHAMVVVGYDDSRQAFKVLNSWGTQWGNGGFGWISYSAFKNRVREAYSVQDIIVNDPTVDPVNPPQPNPDIPVPAPSNNITVNLYAPIITHNVMVSTPLGFYPGMNITVPGMINNGKNAMAQMVVRFYLQNGQPLFANVAEPNFRDINGLAATGTIAMPVLNDAAATGQVIISIPYYALNFAPSNGMNAYNISAQATMYINQFEKARSPFTSMVVRY